MKLLRRLAAVLLGAPTLVAAQVPLIEPSAALECLTPGRDQRGTPEYPFEAWKLGRHGHVQVELTFGSPDRAPAVRVLEHQGDESFVEAVKRHSWKLRVPCLDKDGQQARVVFDYHFRPDERRVVAADPTDPELSARRQQLACIKHSSGQAAPAYPMDARRRDIQGRVYLEMSFTSADSPPDVSVYSARNSGPLHDAIAEWAVGYRMPCFASQAPVVARLTYVYLLDGAGGYGFKDISFMKFLGAVKGIRQQQIDFDFNQMGCPFDIRLTYLQPHRPNGVGQLGNVDPSRRPFLDWLRKAELDLPSRSLEAVYADQLTLTVPCTRINLNPQEKT